MNYPERKHKITIPNFIKKSESVSFVNLNVNFYCCCFWLREQNLLYITVFAIKQLSFDSTIQILIKSRFRNCTLVPENHLDLPLCSGNMSRFTAKFVLPSTLFLKEVDGCLHLRIFIYDREAEIWQFWQDKESWLFLVPEEVIKCILIDYFYKK
jgi:hypothetical protein